MVATLHPQSEAKQTNAQEQVENKQIEPYTTPRTGEIVEHGDKREVESLAGLERTRPGKVYVPAVDIYETSDAVVLVADMPGADEKSVDVSLEKNVLTIYGHVDTPKLEGYSLAYTEYGTGDYQRSFTISNEIDWERIEGTVGDGVLKLVLPKAGPATTKKISIKQG
ncbi:MAG: Hsp20/alpha crystallin family protein [Chloroflexia bacterium]